jgi:quercetin dioxygenase-like cupin family protein
MKMLRLLFALPLLLTVLPASAAETAPAATVSPVMAEALTNAPGQKLTALLVKYPPGGKSAAHRHPGSVFAYVVSGKIRSQNSVTGPAKVYSAGEGFFEPEGSTHLISENASATEPASLLAVFVAPDGATLTMPAMK